MTPARGETVYVLRHFARLAPDDAWQPLNKDDLAALRAMVEGMPALFASASFADFYVAVRLEEVWPGEEPVTELPPNAILQSM